jgi:hypothetical protein
MLLNVFQLIRDFAHDVGWWRRTWAKDLTDGRQYGDNHTRRRDEKKIRVPGLTNKPRIMWSQLGTRTERRRQEALRSEQQAALRRTKFRPPGQPAKLRIQLQHRSIPRRTSRRSLLLQDKLCLTRKPPKPLPALQRERHPVKGAPFRFRCNLVANETPRIGGR